MTLGRRRGTAMVAALGVAELISWGVLIYAFSVLLVPMRSELGWTDAQLSTAYAAGLLVSGLAAVPVGRWLDRHDPHALMATGTALTVAVLLAWSAVTSVATFSLLFVLAGFAMATTLYEPAFAVVAIRLPERHAEAVGLLTVFGGLASVVFVPLTGRLVTMLGWRQALVVLAVIVAAVVLPTHGLLSRGSASGPGRPPARVTPSGDRARTEALRSRSFRWLTLCLVLSTTARVAVSVHLVAYLVERGYPLGQATVLAGGVGLLQVVGRVVATAVRGRFADHVVYGAVFIAQGPSVMLLLLTTGHGAGATVAVVAFIAVFGLGFGLPELLRGILVADYYGTARYASLNGVLALPVAAARALGPAAAGAARTALGNYTATLIACGVLAAASGLALLRAARIHRQERRADR